MKKTLLDEIKEIDLNGIVIPGEEPEGVAEYLESLGEPNEAETKKYWNPFK